MKTVFILLGIIVAGAIAWYALSPLFMNRHVNEAVPLASAPVESLEDAAEPTLSPATERAPISVVLSDSIPVVDTPIHPASGVVRVVKTGDETIIRYENYQTINGPDVRVYLAKDLAATDFVDLGPIKGTSGDINYPIPAGVAVDDYRYVLTWCEDFAVLFNSADLWTVRISQ